jgi:hypothetical protein
MYAKIEGERLRYIRFNQQKLRADDYIHLRDAVNNDIEAHNVGKMVILPATFTGSPRHMHEYTQDAMTYVRKHGRPDLFVTFTCNPTWREIGDHLFFGQTATDRHDILARVFKRKISKLLEIITKQHVFGDTTCWLYTIEWQKRGLPHAHILLWLKEKIKPNELDKIISAEIPDCKEDPLLHETVISHMVHGPCGPWNKNSPCMKDGKCSKRYPRKLIQETQTAEDGYPAYRRRKPGEGGFSKKITMSCGTGYTEVEIDNRWIVPYSPLLLKIFQAHINVEYCHSVQAIKYICKYVHKGNDQAVFQVQEKDLLVDEIESFQMGRYISSNEAIWRIFEFPIHEHYPPVFHLNVHLENGQRVLFSEDNMDQQVANASKTTLTAFFDLCKNDMFAKTLLYPDVPRYFTWNACGKIFVRRKQGEDITEYPGIKSANALGRMYTVHPTSNAECYFLRMLLHTIRGPTSFQDLKTVDGAICETYREACEKRGLLENDQHWEKTMIEAYESQMPNPLRRLFCIILTTCRVSNPLVLWGKCKKYLSDDIFHDLKEKLKNFEEDELLLKAENKTLFLLSDICLSMSGKLLTELGLPSINTVHDKALPAMLYKETHYNKEQLQIEIAEKEPMLLLEQKLIYNKIIRSLQADEEGIFFIDAPGGTGKTFLLNLLLAKVRLDNGIALAVASSGYNCVRLKLIKKNV